MFFRPIGQTRWPPCPLIGWDISKPLNRIQRNLTASKISTSSTKFVFFEPIGKTRWLPWLLIGWNIFYFSSALLNRITKLDRKQNRIVLYQVCVFRVDQYTKMAALVVLSKIWHCSQVHDMWPFGPLVYVESMPFAKIRVWVWVYWCLTSHWTIFQLYMWRPFSRLLRHAGDTEDVFST